MKTSKRSFLVPTAVAVSALLSNATNATPHAASPYQIGEDKKENQIKHLSGFTQEKMIQLNVDGQLQNLVLRKNEMGAVMAYHYSHQSHSSHRSHSSHYSSR